MNSVILFNIAINLPVKDILKLCLSCKKTLKLRQNEYFWQSKFERDYPEILVHTKPENITFLNWFKIFREEHIFTKTDVEIFWVGISNNYISLVDYILRRTIIDCIPIAISMAINKGHLDMTKVLINNHQDIKNHALQEASSMGTYSLVKYLVEIGAEVQFNDNIPLKRAVIGGHANIVKYLIDNGANIYGIYDILWIMAEKYKHLEVMDVLKSFRL